MKNYINLRGECVFPYLFEKNKFDKFSIGLIIQKDSQQYLNLIEFYKQNGVVPNFKNVEDVDGSEVLSQYSNAIKIDAKNNYEVLVYDRQNNKISSTEIWAGDKVEICCLYKKYEDKLSLILKAVKLLEKRTENIEVPASEFFDDLPF